MGRELLLLPDLLLHLLLDPPIVDSDVDSELRAKKGYCVF